MKVSVWKVFGLVMALTGAITMSQAGQGERGQRSKDDGFCKKCKQETQSPERSRHPAKGKRPGREQIMKKYDTDGNGELSETERAAFRSDMEKRRANRPAPSSEEGADRPDRPNRKKVMEQFDADGDGELNKQERKKMRKALEARRQSQAERDGE